MEDKNKENLKNALNSLPEFEPKGSLWDKIDGQMNIASSNKILSLAVNNLPEYSPKDVVWDNIEQVLEADKRLNSNKLGFNRRKMWSAAAAVLLLVGSFYFVTSNGLDAGEKIEYSEEIVDDNLLERDWNLEEDDAFGKILAMCEMESFACTQPVFQSLKAELEELNYARDMLKTAIGEYGTDIELLKELKDIEMLRTSLIKELASQIV